MVNSLAFNFPETNDMLKCLKELQHFQVLISYLKVSESIFPKASLFGANTEFLESFTT